MFSYLCFFDSLYQSRHRLYEDGIWWQNFLCGRDSCVEQFTSSSLSRWLFAFLQEQTQITFLVCVLVIDYVVPFRSSFMHEWLCNATYLLTYQICDKW